MPTGSILFHNIHRNELQARSLKAMIGDELTPGTRPNIIVNGLAKHDCFPVTFNSFESWDPKLELGSHCIVLDNGHFYQWEIGTLESVERLNRARYNSCLFDVSNLQKINDEIYVLRNQFSRKEIDIIEARKKAKFLYRELERQRQPIRVALLEYHRSKVSSMLTSIQSISNSVITEDDPVGKVSNENIYGIPYYSRPLIVSMEKAFDYFSDIESYPERYPDYCKKVEVLQRSYNNIITREFWNIMIKEDIDHVVLDVRYSFYRPKAIHYEIIGGYEKAVGFKNAIFLRQSKNESFCRRK